MPQIINRSQQVVSAGMNPRPAYSRLIMVGVSVGAGLGASAMVITDPIGSTFRINSIMVNLSSLDPGVVAWVRWQLYIGKRAKTTAQQVHDGWERLFPSCLTARHPDMRICGSISTRYEVTKIFKGEPMSLAAYLYNWSAAVGCDVEFGIEISEG